MGKHEYVGESELIIPGTAHGTVVIEHGDVVEVLDQQADEALSGRPDFQDAPDSAVATSNTLTRAERDGATVEAAPPVQAEEPAPVPTQPAPVGPFLSNPVPAEQAPVADTAGDIPQPSVD